MTVASSRSMLEQLEAEARERGLLLRLQVGRPLGLWSLRLVVAQQGSSGKLLLGEMKGWAYSAATGLQLDTMRVMPKAPACLLYTSPSPRDYAASRMPSSA